MFRVYRGQWDILIILPEKSVLLGFHCWWYMRARYEVLVAPRDLIARCLFSCELLFQIWDYLFRVNVVLMNFSRSRFRNCFCELFLMNWFKYKPGRSSLNEELHLILLSSFNRIHLGSKFKKQPFRAFRGPCKISRFFLSKNYVLVFFC